jgi:hypothetical protein
MLLLTHVLVNGEVLFGVPAPAQKEACQTSTGTMEKRQLLHLRKRSARYLSFSRESTVTVPCRGKAVDAITRW